MGSFLKTIKIFRKSTFFSVKQKSEMVGGAAGGAQRFAIVVGADRNLPHCCLSGTAKDSSAPSKVYLVHLDPVLTSLLVSLCFGRHLELNLMLFTQTTDDVLFIF